MRYNSSKQLVEYNGMCVSGWLAVESGDTIRFKNITVAGTTTGYLVRYNQNGALQVLDISTLGSPDENGVYTFVADQYYTGIRLCIGTISDDTIVTKNEPIV